MLAKRLRVLQTFTREPDEIVVRTTRDAIAGLKENKYSPNPPADPATLEANHNIRADCDCLLHKCRCSRLEWCSCIDDRIACANHTAKRIVKISAGYVRFKTRKRRRCRHGMGFMSTCRRIQAGRAQIFPAHFFLTKFYSKRKIREPYMLFKS